MKTSRIPFGPSAEERVARLMPFSGVQTAITGGGNVPISENWWAVDTTNKWQTTLTGTGAVTRVSTNNQRPTVNINCAAAADAVNLSNRREIYKGGYGATSPSSRRIYTKMVLEWEWMVDANLANFNNTSFFMGLVLGHGDSRATVNIVGFGLASDALQIVADISGTETTSTPTAPTGGLTIVHSYAMVCDVNSIRLYIDRTLAGTVAASEAHANAAFFSIYQEAEGGGACNSQLGPVHCYYIPNSTLLA